MPILKKPTTTTTQSNKAPNSGGAGAKKVDAFAQRFNATEPKEGKGFNPPPPGTYNCLVIEAQGVVEGEKSTGYFELVICDDGDSLGKTFRKYWNFKNDKGEDMDLSYFRADMAMLGVEEITSWDDMCEIFAQLATEEKWVIVNAVLSKPASNGKQYTNFYFESVPKNQAEKPERPPF